MKYLKAFALAWNMLTIIPLFKVHDFFKGINGISAMFYPLIGFILGMLLYGAYSGLSVVFPPVHAAVATFVLWVVLTGALHLDGFSDCIDGLFVPKQKALAVMKESYVGGMGMILSVVFILFKASSLIFLNDLLFLPLILALARLNAVITIYLFPYISSGVGRLIKEELTFLHVAFALLYVGGWSFFMNSLWLVPISLFFGIFLALLFQKRYGGLNGDMYGFIIETSELFLLNTLIVAVV